MHQSVEFPGGFSMKKYIAEMLGTAVLVFVGCGSVAIAGYGGALPNGILPIALAFGLSVTAMAYCIGPISGCHINPAVTAAVWASGRMKTSDVPGYVIAQFIGGFVGAGILALILMGKTGGYNIQTAGLGQTTFAPGYSFLSAFLVEGIATFIFTMVILGCTRAKGGAGNAAGLIIGLTLALLHLAFVPATGNSLNPARTFAPNLYVGGAAFAQVWLYLIAPTLGGLLAGFVFRARILETDGVE
jgi:aquaporin Z